MIRLASLLLVPVLFAGGCARTVRVATDAVFPPFHYVDDEGSVTGHDVELALIALERIGADAVVVHVDSYAELLEGLKAGRHDLVAATTGITPERERIYAFTRPYFVTCLAVVVRSAPEKTVSLAGARIAASKGTTSVAAAQALTSIRVVESTGAEAIASLRAGDLDAVVMDEFEAVELARSDPDLAVLPQPAALERYGFVLRLEDASLRDRLNEALADLEADGTIEALRERYGLERPTDWPVDLGE